MVKAMDFSVVMYRCESWTIKEAERLRIDAFESWCWRRLLRVPWTARRSKQPVLKEINPGYSLEGLMLKLKLQYFGHLMRRADSLEKTLILGKIEGKRRGQQRMRWLTGITDSMNMSLSKLWDQWRTGKSGMLQSMGLQRVRHDLVTKWHVPNSAWSKATTDPTPPDACYSLTESSFSRKTNFWNFPCGLSWHFLWARGDAGLVTKNVFHLSWVPWVNS